ncbi:hypothetical protein RJ640_011123 [Escallonia rubra]|uniref:Pyridine nucleotide-disulfide oxidoreductase domain-containing protein 2 n=1 Tax=Escallonia rubra TaxID=112253 RepID=A0AA88R8X2_9ASTE|nr:hypothetical protein RJ640_011123 [Escallonia rubra]
MWRRGFCSGSTRGALKEKKWDALVIGGGHNGLTAAAYLARSGLSVAVLERRHLVGGAAVTEELIPGFKFSRCSYLQSLLRPSIIRVRQALRKIAKCHFPINQVKEIKVHSKDLLFIVCIADVKRIRVTEAWIEATEEESVVVHAMS